MEKKIIFLENLERKNAKIIKILFEQKSLNNDNLQEYYNVLNSTRYLYKEVKKILNLLQKENSSIVNNYYLYLKTKKLKARTKELLKTLNSLVHS